MHNKNFGDRGESIACDYLTHNGYEILSRNFRSKFGEIDIVAKNNNTIYFVEVKTRSNLKKGMPYEAVNYRKQRQLHKAATYFLLTNNYTKYKCNIGVICILLKEEKKHQLEFYSNID